MWYIVSGLPSAIILITVGKLGTCVCGKWSFVTSVAAERCANWRMSNEVNEWWVNSSWPIEVDLEISIPPPVWQLALNRRGWMDMSEMFLASNLALHEEWNCVSFFVVSFEINLSWKFVLYLNDSFWNDFAVRALSESLYQDWNKVK